MADGDDREENADGKQPSDSNLPDLENLQIEQLENPEDITEEYMALDSQLNQLDACLDSLEARNDDLMAKLKAFLQDGTLAPSTPPSDDPDSHDDGGRDAEDKQGSTGASDGEGKAADSATCS